MKDKLPAKRADKSLAPEAQLKSFLGRFEPKIQKLARSMRTALRKKFPAANELAYNYPSSVVIGYSPTEGGIDSVVALATRADGVFLYFNQGPHLPDPEGILMGTGKQTRFIPVDSVRRLAHPAVKALITAAVEASRVPMPARGRGSLTIRSSGARKKAARKPKK